MNCRLRWCMPCVKCGVPSRLEVVVTIADSSNMVNIVHYSSVKTKRVTRNMLVVKLFALAHAIEFAITLRETINEILERKLQ